MTKPKVESYRKASAKIASGAWSVDTTSGALIGTRGQPYRRQNSDGYVQVTFRDPEARGRNVYVLAHRVIFEHVNGPLDESLTVNHINGDKLDNRPENLEAIPHAANVEHAVRTKLYHRNCWYCRHNGGRHYPVN